VAGASRDDVVLVLGRGHESHQELAGHHLPLDDRSLVRTALDAWRVAATSDPEAVQ
jgi:UDP-N-acetylmuramyl tripeptide synthase